MRRPHFLTPRVERILERVGFAAYILLAVVTLGRQYVAGVAGSTVAPSATAGVTASPTALIATAAAVATAASSAAATTTASPSPTRDPLVVSAYVNAGRHFAAMTAPLGYTLVSPISGNVSIVVYQFLGGEIRVGSNIPDQPFFPYVTVTSAEVKLIVRPGALKDDVQLLVKDGDTIRAGTPLFTIVGRGASSWRTFYDPHLDAQVLASATRPSGAELDPVALFAR